MIGLLAYYRGMVVVTMAPTHEEAEEIAVILFEEAGHALRGVEMDLTFFEPTNYGGLLIDTSDGGTWGPEGWTPS